MQEVNGLECVPAWECQHQRPQQTEGSIDQARSKHVGQGKLERRDGADRKHRSQPRMREPQQHREQVIPDGSQVRRACENRALKWKRFSGDDRVRDTHIAREIHVNNRKGYRADVHHHQKRDGEHGQTAGRRGSEVHVGMPGDRTRRDSLLQEPRTQPARTRAQARHDPGPIWLPISKTDHSLRSTSKR